MMKIVKQTKQVKQISPILGDHLSQIYTSEQTLHELIPTALRQIQDEQMTTAFGDLLAFTMGSSRRMGQVTSLLDTSLKPRAPQINQALAEELKQSLSKTKTAYEQTQLLELLHKYLGNLFTDYTYTINLVANEDSKAKDAIDLLQESIDELKRCNDELSRLALKKISAVKKDQVKQVQQITSITNGGLVLRPRVSLQGGVSERYASVKSESTRSVKGRENSVKGFSSRIKSAWATLKER